jgi:hypothetical protein
MTELQREDDERLMRAITNTIYVKSYGSTGNTKINKSIILPPYLGGKAGLT